MPSEFQGGCKKYPLNISFLVSFLLPPPNFFKTIFLDQHFSGTISRNTFLPPIMSAWHSRSILDFGEFSPFYSDSLQVGEFHGILFWIAEMFAAMHREIL
jgi:hypothetical protein